MARILLADDDDDMVEICERLFPRYGFELVVARNAREAVDMAKADHPDLILMDMRMPLGENESVDDLAGIQATKEIRQAEALHATPVIALTGHMMTKFRENVVGAGCVDFFPKPIDDFNKLIEMIERHLPKL